MPDGQKLLDAVIGICGLPPIRGTAVIRRAFWEINKQPEHATIEDYLAALPQIEKALQAYMASKVAKQRTETLREFLEQGPDALEDAPTLESIASSFREATKKLKESQQLNIIGKTPTRRLRSVKEEEESD